jgi:hypothetical protein
MEITGGIKTNYQHAELLASSDLTLASISRTDSRTGSNPAPAG